MEASGHGHGEPRVERWLVRSRPAPDPGWLSQLEDELFPPVRDGRRAWSLRPALAAGLAAAAVASAAVVLGLAGAGPLGAGGNDTVRAGDRCRYQTVMRRERVPVVVTRADGSLDLAYRIERVERRVKRCR